MKTKMQWVVIVLALLAGLHQAAAQGTTAFTYQGQLQDGGTNANGTYTMIFALYDSASGGDQIGSAITNSPTLANGLFTVSLDFGAGAFNGTARWLDITVTNGGESQELTPRVQVLPSPYALFAVTAGTVTNGAIMNSQLAANAVATANIQSNAITTALIASNAVTNPDLASNAVATINITNGAVTPVKLATNSAGLNNVTGGEAFMTNTVSDSQSNPTMLVNGYVQSTLGGFIFPDGSVQDTAAAATPSHGITNFDAATNFDGPLTNYFTVPAGVTKLYIEAWGGGGGAGGAGSSYYGGGYYIVTGGSGGAGGYARGVIEVTPLECLIIEVGNAGTNGASVPLTSGEDGFPGLDGGDTFIAASKDTNDVLFLCGGGGGGDGGPSDFSAPNPGTGGEAEPSAGIQRPGFPGDSAPNAGFGAVGPLGTLQPVLNPVVPQDLGPYSFVTVTTYGSAGNGKYPSYSYATGGCVVIQW